MNQAYFSDIRSKIINNIDAAKDEILICMAWFTSKEILGKLIDKAENGCTVKIIISDHIENKRLNFKNYQEKKGSISILSTNSGKFLHDKFAIFDKKTIIIGSYNWTNSAEYYNHEFIVLSDDELLVRQFSARFRSLEKIVQDYKIEKLATLAAFDSESREDEFEKLEKELLQELIEAIDLSLEAGAKVNKSTILDLLYRYGAVGASERLIKDGAGKMQSGLIKMFEIQRLDLTFENIILKPKYRILFSNDLLEKAEEKLKKLGYSNFN